MLHSLRPGHAALLIRRESGNLQTEGPTSAALGYCVNSGGPAITEKQFAEELAGANPDRPEGTWVRWRWDGKELVAENDRFGFLPLFYAVTPNGVAVSTRLADLLSSGVSARPDFPAIAVFLRLGYYIGADTPLEDIRSLEPGQTLRWSPQRGLQISTHAPELPSGCSALSRDDAVRLYGEKMQVAVEDMLPPEEASFCVPLSAGRDSRHILYALLRAGRTPDEVLTVQSAPPRPSTDAEMAGRITAALGLPHAVIPQYPNRLDQDLRKNRLCGWMADEHAPLLPVADHIREQRYQYSWDGIAGDIFSCGVYDSDDMLGQFREGRLNELADWFLDDEGYLPRWMPAPMYQQCSREVARDRLAAELGCYAHLPNPAAPFFFHNRVRRELGLSPYGIMNSKTQILAPYLSHDVFDLLIDLPFEYFRGREFHSEAIDAFYPELPQFPYVSTDTGSVLQKRSFNLRFGRDWLSQIQTEWKDCPAVRPGFLIPRLLKGVFSRGYGTELPVLFSRPLVLSDLFCELRKMETAGHSNPPAAESRPAPQAVRAASAEPAGV